MAKVKVGVLISGHGSNLKALIDAAREAHYPAEIAVVISSREDAHGLTHAKAAGIPAHVISHKAYPSREAFDDAMHQMLERHLADIVCLAGFMHMLSSRFVKNWHNKLLNVHPSLLPAFKGLNVHKEVIKAGVRFSGCTVHFVRPDVDSGPIIVQAVVPVCPQDTPEQLAAHVLKQEHRIYPMALRWLAEGRLTIKDEKVMVQAVGAPPGVLINPAG